MFGGVYKCSEKIDLNLNISIIKIMITNIYNILRAAINGQVKILYLETKPLR